GVAICLALTRPGGPVGAIYAADLAGAAAGCLLTVGVLWVADAPAAVFAVAAVAGAGAFVFAAAAGRPRLAARARPLALLGLWGVGGRAGGPPPPVGRGRAGAGAAAPRALKQLLGDRDRGRPPRRPPAVRLGAEPALSARRPDPPAPPVDRRRRRHRADAL